jgi:hypothetical protein
MTSKKPCAKIYTDESTSECEGRIPIAAQAGPRHAGFAIASHGFLAAE